jgi:hypothetical protein
MATKRRLSVVALVSALAVGASSVRREARAEEQGNTRDLVIVDSRTDQIVSVIRAILP